MDLGSLGLRHALFENKCVGVIHLSTWRIISA